MTNSEPLVRKIEYRGRWLSVSRLAKQWQIEIAPTFDSPDPQVLKGWNEEEVFKRAKTRIDDMLVRRHP
jgi:hypothetical protein